MLRIGEQEILTPGTGQVLETLMRAQRRGQKIVSCCPHFGIHGPIPSADVIGYIVIVENTEESVRKALQEMT